MIDDQDWEETSVEEARDLSEEGWMIYWRPHMKHYSIDNPDNDLAWVCDVR